MGRHLHLGNCLREMFPAARKSAYAVATRHPVCPVLIHTTNSLAAPGMELVFEDGGWLHSRIVPYNDLEWVPEVWITKVLEALGKAPAGAEVLCRFDPTFPITAVTSSLANDSRIYPTLIEPPAKEIITITSGRHIERWHQPHGSSQCAGLA